MKDRVFEGRDVPRAVEAASLALGLPAADLRYVVLEEGQEASGSAPAAPARIAVLLDAMAERPAAPRAPAPRPPAGPEARVPGDAKLRLRRLVAAFAEATGEPLAVSFDDGDETLVVRVSGAGESLLLQDGGEPLRALEHVLQRACSREEPRRIQLSSVRFRSERDAYLKQRALELAEAVRRDGVPRETEPLNSYDRRQVHLAFQNDPDLKSFSVGEGSARRVTVAPRSADPASNPELQ
jgi:spoIIIJ-associated protein